MALNYNLAAEDNDYVNDSSNFFEEQLELLGNIHFTRRTRNGVLHALHISKIRLEPEKHDLLINSTVSANSRKSYMKHYRGLFKFLAMIGDYHSMILFHNNKARDVVESMNARSIAQYLMFKTVSCGTVLRCPSTNIIIINCFNNEPILSEGDWNDKGNVEQFLCAVSKIHGTIYQVGAYTDRCESCIEARELNNGSTGCFHHTGRHKFFRRGNPRNSPEVNNAKSKCVELCKNHLRSKCSRILPCEMQKLRRYLCNSNSIDDYQLYVMTLVAIHLFLRFDELHDMCVDHFLSQLSTIHGNNVYNLVFKVKGKNDDTWKLLVLWRYDEVPTLCGVRHLLFYIHLRQIKRGYLFPKFGSRKQFGYQEYRSLLREKYNPILGYDRKLTSHLYRSSGYLFAVFGGGKFEVIKEAARHKTSDVAMSYFQDAETLKATLELPGLQGFMNPENRVPHWRPPYFTSPEHAVTLNTEMHAYNNNALHNVSKDMVERMCGLNDVNILKSNIASHLERIHNYRPPLSAVETMQQVIQSCPVSVQRDIMIIVNNLVNQTQVCRCSITRSSVNRTHPNGNRSLVEVNTNHQGVDFPRPLVGVNSNHQGVNFPRALVGVDSNNQGATFASNGFIELNIPTQTARINSESNQQLQMAVDSADAQEHEINETVDCGVHNNSQLRKKRKGTIDLQDRKKLKNIKSPKERLDLVLELHDEYINASNNPGGDKFTEGARQYYFVVLRPIKNCFHKHFNEDKDKFLEQYSKGLSDLRRFKEKCCAGHQDECLPIPPKY